MNKSQGKGLVYATVAAAALFVAVVSGTFAYFTASASNNAVQGTVANVGLTLSVTKVSATGTNGGGSLIPLKVTTTPGATGDLLPTALTQTNQCVDNNGYTVCQVYQITLTPSSSVLLTGTLVVSSTTATNLKWELLASQTARATTPTIVSVNNTGYIAGTSTAGTVLSSATTYYVVVWINETGSAQTDSGSFNGTVTFTGNGDTAGQITAKFS